MRRGTAVWVGWPGGAARFERDEAMAKGAFKDGAVRAPLTGKVIKVDVQVGQAVEADAVLVVLEAMKMEYRLTAPRAGKVGAVSCAVGELVDQGRTLVELDGDAPGPG